LFATEIPARQSFERTRQKAVAQAQELELLDDHRRREELPFQHRLFQHGVELLVIRFGYGGAGGHRRRCGALRAVAPALPIRAPARNPRRLVFIGMGVTREKESAPLLYTRHT
jgi:hypothetical protein